jgi:Tfp pilus assembly protein PilN
MNTPQINLLPDVKQAYLKAKRQKRYVTFIATWVTIGAASLLVLLLLVVQVWQRARLNSLNDSIKTNSSKIMNLTDFDKVLTIQNQLKTLSGLHEQKPAADRLFTYLNQVVPDKSVTISRFTIDFIGAAVEVRGEADNLEAVNKFIDILKFTDYQLTGSETTTRAFQNVLLSSFSRDDTTAAYTVTFTFDPTLFANSSQVTLVVPEITTTRSETERPTNLFKESTIPEADADAEGAGQ